MSFRFRLNGNALDFDCVPDAIALVGPILQPQITRGPSRSTRAASSEVTAINLDAARSWQPPENLRAFVSALEAHERIALGLLATHGDEVWLDQLREAAGLDSTGDASKMLAHMKRVAFDHDVDWPKLLSFRIAGTRHERTSVYTPGPLLTNRPGSE